MQKKTQATGDALSLEEKIEAIYRREQNAEIAWFFDGGFDVTIGDSVNGFVSKDNFATIAEAVDWLYQYAIDSMEET